MGAALWSAGSCAILNSMELRSRLRMEKSPGYFAHDGGVSRTLDGYGGLEDGSCSGTNQFDSLSQTLGSMTEFVSVSVHPTDPDIMFGGAQNNGSPKTSAATSSTAWQNALGGDGGFTAVNPANSNEWFTANPYVTILKCESGAACNNSGFSQVVGSENLGGDSGAYFTPYILDPQKQWRIAGGNLPSVASEYERHRAAAA